MMDETEKYESEENVVDYDQNDVVAQETEVAVVDSEYQENPMYNSESEVYGEPTDEVITGDDGQRKSQGPLKPLDNLMQRLDNFGPFGYLCAMTVATFVVWIASIIKVAEADSAIFFPNGIATGVPADYKAYAGAALGFSTISLVMCIVLIIVSRVAVEIEQKIAPIFSIILVVLWIAAAGTATFKYPFPNLGNGWIGSWVALITSYIYMTLSFSHFSKVKENLDKQTENKVGRQSFGILLSSVVVMIASIVTYVHFACPNANKQCWSSAYGIGISCISIVFMIVIIVLSNVAKDKSDTVINVLALINAGMWFVSAFIMTFYAPFEGAESICGQGSFFILNGYVGTLVVVAFSVGLFQGTALPWLREKCGKGDKMKDSDDEYVVESTTTTVEG